MAGPRSIRWLGGLCQSGGDNGHRIDLLRVAAAGEVVDGGVQAEQDGAVGVEVAETLGDLVADVARVDVGEDESVGVAADAVGDMLGLGDDGGDRRVELELAADGGVGHFGLGLLAGVAHLVDVLALAGAERGVAQESDLGIDAEDLRALDGLAADLDQLVLGGLDVDGAVRHGQHLVLTGRGGTDHDEAGGDDVAAGLGLDELQRGTHGVRGGVGRAAEQAVGHAHLDEHGAEVVALLQRVAALLGRHLALAQLDHLLDHRVHLGIVRGIGDLGAADVEAGVLGGRGDLLGIADEHGLEEVTGQQTGARLEDAGVGAFGKDDGFGALFQGCDQLTKHIEIPPNFCAAGGRQELTGTVYTSFFRVSTPNHKKFTIFP